MATKNSKSKAPAVAAITLAMIVAAGADGMFTPASVHAPLVEAGHVEINTAVVDAEGNVATRATPEGIAAVNTPADTNQAPALQAAAPKPAFKIDDGVPVPTITGRGRTGNKYPFDDLAVGQSFFVANDESKPNAAKSLASTVSSATARHAVATGETKTNDKGESVPVMKATRQFIVRSVDETEKGGGVGARVWRTA